MCTHAQLARSAAIASQFPMLGSLARGIADAAARQRRHDRGRFGPRTTPPPAGLAGVLALAARTSSPTGAPSQLMFFFKASSRPALQPGEWILGVQFPRCCGRITASWSRRHRALRWWAWPRPAWRRARRVWPSPAAATASRAGRRRKWLCRPAGACTPRIPWSFDADSRPIRPARQRAVPRALGCGAGTPGSSWPAPGASGHAHWPPQRAHRDSSRRSTRWARCGCAPRSTACTAASCCPRHPVRRGGACWSPAVLAQCIPGCVSIQRTSPSTTWPLSRWAWGRSATFETQVTVVPGTPFALHPSSVLPAGAVGHAGALGEGKATVFVQLRATHQPDTQSAATRLDWQATPQVSGTLAQLGNRLVDASANSLSQQFFSRLRTSGWHAQTPFTFLPACPGDYHPAMGAAHPHKVTTMTTPNPPRPDQYSAPLNLGQWLGANAQLLQPPVGNQQIWRNADLICTVVRRAQPTHRLPCRSLRGSTFHQFKGNASLLVADRASLSGCTCAKVMCFCCPPGCGTRPSGPSLAVCAPSLSAAAQTGVLDAFEWYCARCGALVSTPANSSCTASWKTCPRRLRRFTKPARPSASAPTAARCMPGAIGRPGTGCVNNVL